MAAPGAEHRKRQSVKASSFTAKDKDELKQKCLQKVRQERGRLVARLRRERTSRALADPLALHPVAEPSSLSPAASSLEGTPPPGQGHLTGAARDILNHGLRSFGIRAIASGADADAADTDMLDGDDGGHDRQAGERAVQKLHAAAATAAREMAGAEAGRGEGGDDWRDDDTPSMCRKLTPEEYTDMMLFIEQATARCAAAAAACVSHARPIALAAELARADASAEHSALEEYEAIEEYELAEREAALARAAAEAEDGRGWRDDEVLCPVCKGGWLLQHGATIMCTCGFRLQTDGEGMQLGVLRQALAEVFTDHRERCHLQPTFRVREEFGAAMLWSECSACGFEQIVL